MKKYRPKLERQKVETFRPLTAMELAMLQTLRLRGKLTTDSPLVTVLSQPQYATQAIQVAYVHDRDFTIAYLSVSDYSGSLPEHTTLLGASKRSYLDKPYTLIGNLQALRRAAKGVGL